MFKRKLTQSNYSLITANILPVVGVYAWGWSPYEVFLVYCLETIIVGVFNFVKMGIVTVIRKTDIWTYQGSSTKQSGILFMLFFLIHYGIFVGVQMFLFFSVSGIGKEINIDVFNFFYKWPQLIDKETLIMLGTFIFCYGHQMFYDFILSKQYRTIPMPLLMFQPYGRIIIQQFTVIVGSMFLSFGAGKLFILIFALFKIFFEIYFNFENILNKSMNDVNKELGEG